MIILVIHSLSLENKRCGLCEVFNLASFAVVISVLFMSPLWHVPACRLRYTHLLCFIQFP